MNAQNIAVITLLVLGVGTELVCCLALPLLRTTYDRVHAVGPASILGSTLIAAAVITKEALSPIGVKAILIVLLLWLASPVLTHATARAAFLRDRGTGHRLHGVPPVDL